MEISYFKNKKVTIIGLGLHGGGVGVAKFFSRLGAKVLVTDLRNKEELKESLEKLKGRPIKYVLNQHRPEDFINTDLVIKNPAVPDKSKYLEIARQHGVPIETDIGIFFELCPAPIIGITGSKGKSTVAALAAELLAKKYDDVVLAGNIRSSVLTKFKKINKDSPVVLELSSWQLAGLRTHRKSPRCSLITNILPDHLNRYKNIEEYIEDKKEIFRWQKAKIRPKKSQDLFHGRDYLILNYDDKTVRSFAEQAKAQTFYYSQDNGITSNLERASLASFVKGGKIFFGQEEKEEICSLDDIRLKGKHNIDNVLAAVSIAKLCQVSNKSIKKVLTKFKGLEGRLELVKIVNGIKYINDTTATIPEATLASLASFPLKKNIVLIAGGADKNLNFEQLAEIVVKRVKALILLEGTATSKLKTAIENQISLTDSQLEIVGPLDNMKEAVAEAKLRLEKLAGPESDSAGLVLLSPACASFGLFRHEFERGQAFVEAVDKL